MDEVSGLLGDRQTPGVEGSAVFAWSLFGLDPLVSAPIAGLSIALLGALMYATAVRRVLGRSLLAQVIVTFGLQVFFRGLAQFIWKPDTRTITHTWAGELRWTVGSVVIGGPQLVTAGGALLTTLAVALFMNRTRLGSGIRAAGAGWCKESLGCTCRATPWPRHWRCTSP